MDDNKACPSCDFDTIPVVTVNIKDWDYCPVCGTGLISIEDDMKSDNSQEEKEMKSIPIGDNNTDEQDTVAENVSDSTDEQDTNQGENVDSDNDLEDKNLEEEIEEQETQNFVEEELDRLRDRFGKDEDED